MHKIARLLYPIGIVLQAKQQATRTSPTPEHCTQFMLAMGICDWPPC
jgi:hypothetical protein